MRIVWSVPVLAGGLGSGRGDLARAAALVAALRDAGHEVTVVEAARTDDGGRARGLYRGVLRRLLPERIALVLRDVARRWEARRHARRVAAAVRAAGADVLVETQVHGLPSGGRAAREADLPLVLDDVSPPAEERTLGAGLPGSAERAFRRQARAARLLVVSSVSLRRRLAAEGADERRIAVVPNGVDLAAHEAADREEARRRLGIGDRLALAFAGSFQPWHRPVSLVEAAAPIADARDLHLVLIGDGPERGPALAAARRRGLEDRVTAPGAVAPDEVPALLAGCDVGVLPGTNDYGQPMKLLAYAAAGLAIAAPDLAPVREVVEDGVTALLFEPDGPEALESALRRLAADPDLRTALGARARRDVAAPAGWGERAARLARLLEGVVGDAEEEGRGTGDPTREAPS